ncbi:MAG: hypothetical protein IV090_21960 [Candidatus Sericytochromatia bacterium]|nr:hypothetical protein [Candidatus Sericytochromatia bacterium]
MLLITRKELGTIAIMLRHRVFNFMKPKNRLALILVIGLFLIGFTFYWFAVGFYPTRRYQFQAKVLAVTLQEDKFYRIKIKYPSDLGLTGENRSEFLARYRGYERSRLCGKEPIRVGQMVKIEILTYTTAEIHHRCKAK